MKAYVLVFAAAACGTSRTEAMRSPVSTAALPVGAGVALVSAGGMSYVFDGDKVAIFRGSTVVARASTPKNVGRSTRWTAAASLRGPDGKRWIVGIANGELWRVTSTGDLELAGVRLGVGDARVLSIAASADAWIIGLVGGFAVSSDGIHVRRYTGADATVVSISSGRFAVGTSEGVDVYDVAASTRTRYQARAETLAFLGSGAQSLVLTDRETVYVERQGVLERVAGSGDVQQIAVSDSRVWLLGRSALFSFDGAALARMDLKVEGTRIHPASNGDVWIARDERVARYTLEHATLTSWQQQVAAAFERGCAGCHRAGGEANLDLSSAVTWLDQRDAIREALTAGVMPPEGHALSAADRERMLRWLGR